MSKPEFGAMGHKLDPDYSLPLCHSIQKVGIITITVTGLSRTYKTIIRFVRNNNQGSHKTGNLEESGNLISLELSGKCQGILK